MLKAFAERCERPTEGRNRKTGEETGEGQRRRKEKGENDDGGDGTHQNKEELKDEKGT